MNANELSEDFESGVEPVRISRGTNGSVCRAPVDICPLLAHVRPVCACPASGGSNCQPGRKTPVYALVEFLTCITSPEE
jgi:hypothetical protein